MGEKRDNTSVAINFYDNCNNKFCQSFPTDGVSREIFDYTKGGWIIEFVVEIRTEGNA